VKENDMLPPDRLNEIGVLKRREIEARILLPVIEALGKEFGKERVVEIVRDVIVNVAQAQGREVAAQQGGTSLGHLAHALEDWQKGDAYRMDVLEQGDERFSFNVTRCRYAEMYRSLGIPELGGAALLQPRLRPGGRLQSRHRADPDADHHAGRAALRLPLRQARQAGDVLTFMSMESTMIRVHVAS
jgi:hypothetical protein